MVEMNKEEKEFAFTRSQKHADISNEHSRATSQACILINGGAATAVIAFLAKDKLDPSFLGPASLALVTYAAGVFLGAFGLYCATQATDFFSQYWLDLVRGLEEAATRADRKGTRWWTAFHYAIIASCLTFGIASAVLAGAMYTFPTPQPSAFTQ